MPLLAFLTEIVDENYFVYETKFNLFTLKTLWIWKSAQNEATTVSDHLTA